MLRDRREIGTQASRENMPANTGGVQR